jgi:hypothetical protein
VEERVAAVTDTAILRQLLREAATVGTIDDFMEKVAVLTGKK